MSKLSGLFQIISHFRTVSQPSGFFQIISPFLNGVKTVRIFLDHFPFSGRFHNCPDFSRSFPIFQTVLKLCILPSHILYYNSRKLNMHSLAMLWEANTRFLCLLREMISRALSGKFLRVKIAIQKVLGFCASRLRNQLSPPVCLPYWQPNTKVHKFNYCQQ